MKKVIFIILVIIGILLISFGAYYLINNNKKDIPKKLDGYDIVDFATIDTCLDEACENKITDYYSDISYDYDSQVLQDAIKKLNKKTKEYYELANSSTRDAECLISPSVNTKGTRISSNYSVYSDGKIITLNIQRTKYNICNNDSESYKPENYVYDTESDKMLSFEEAKEKFSVSDNDILEAIKKTNEVFGSDINMQIETKEKYTDLSFYYNTIGDLLVSYPVPELNGYASALIRENV